MPLIPFVKTGYLGTNQWVPLVNGNGLTAGGGEPVPEIVWVKVSGTSPLSLPGAIANAIKSLTQYGLCTQATTPTPDSPVDIVCNNGTIKWDSVNQRVYTDGTLEVLTVSASGAGAQTAAVVDLYSVGDIADEQEIISGGVTHRIGCHVFDGTETFSKSSAYGQAFLINAASASWGADRTASVLCTHFLGLPQTKSSQEDNTCFFNQTGHFYIRVTDNSDPAAFKAWLAEQYASGNPVIVWFVLAAETTESVTAQPLSTVEGDNTVSVTANVSPVALECEYANGYAQ